MRHPIVGAVMDVVVWLRSLGLGKYEAIFRENEIDEAVKFGNLFLREGDTFRAVAWYGEATYVENRRRVPLVIQTEVPDLPLARLVETKQRIHIADLREEIAYKAGFAPLVTLVDSGGARTLLAVPLLKQQQFIGAFGIYRQEVRPFTDKQIALVENFADQAVIAIENARLLNELRERTDQLQVQSKELANLNQHLEQRVTDQVDEIERMSRLRRFLPPQVADLIVASGSEKQLEKPSTRDYRRDGLAARLPRGYRRNHHQVQRHTRTIRW